jgi:hypothetical protein
MRILFDQGSSVTNGELIRLAEQAGDELLITTDTNLRYQQNLQRRSIAIVVLSTTSWPRIRKGAKPIAMVIMEIEAGSYLELTIP